MSDDNAGQRVPFFFPPGMGPAEIASALRAAAERVVWERAERERADQQATRPADPPRAAPEAGPNK